MASRDYAARFRPEARRVFIDVLCVRSGQRSIGADALRMQRAVT
ncbi:hypothetical protein C7408_101122 [Paraburkholderia caballeronis]|nr:hypothetical protein C7406_108122 [Paraburkholderia caballeronis]TDV20614.1 hypothetical protein C7408_101122 [Paraburkholderia caballeronis]TDV33082.1 hypothetical protein C7404_101218 [Paraburkholderia caballeronis]